MSCSRLTSRGPQSESNVEEISIVAVFAEPWIDIQPNELQDVWCNIANLKRLHCVHL